MLPQNRIPPSCRTGRRRPLAFCAEVGANGPRQAAGMTICVHIGPIQAQNAIARETTMRERADARR